MPDKHPLSVAELTELPTDSWVNDGFTAVIRSIERKVSKANKPFWKCKLADTTGSATVGMTLFVSPKFNEGDQVDFLGSGIKFKNGTQYGPEVSVGDKAEIHVVGKSVHAPEQAARAAVGAPAVNGTPQPVNGQTVGMAMKLATDLLIEGGDSIALDTQAYWQRIHAIASHIIRVSRALEAGKLTPASWAKPDPAPAPQPVRQPAPKPQPGPDGSAFPVGQGADEDAF